MRMPIFFLFLAEVAGWSAGRAQTPAAISVVRLDPALDELVPKGAALEKVAGDFVFTEGPVWARKGRGSLLFSDIPANVIREWSPGGKMSVFLEKSGFTCASATPIPRRSCHSKACIC